MTVTTTTHTTLSRRRLTHRFRRLAPLLVWSVVLLAAVSLYLRQESGLTVVGFVRATRYQVASEAAGRLHRLEVPLNAEVSAGQIVASLDDEELRLQLREARAELDRLAMDLARQRVTFEIDRQTNLRRFARDATAAHVEYLEALTDLAEDRITLQGLEITLNRSRQLRESEVAPEASLEADRIAFEALEARISRHEETVSALLLAYQDAQKRRGAILAETPEVAELPVLQASALAAQEVRIEMVNLAIARRVLRAPTAGRVVEVYRRSGEVIAAGQPVLEILETRGHELVAYLPEQRVLDVNVGDEVVARRVADRGQTFVGSVACLGAGVDRVPPRLSPDTAAQSWGRAVFVQLPVAMAAQPGEAFEISIR